ncbi:MAG TPA: helix-turn-helix transcriptional regulator [Methylophilaceae bacterium]|nr:helix-turn-helix transcriptional regulator [Methylophilaceae bacterium]
MKLEARIATRLREAREEAKLTLEALGVAAGIEEETAKVRMHQYEQGKHQPPYAMLERLAEVLRKPVLWFVCDEGQKSVVLAIEALSEAELGVMELYAKQLLEGRTTETR